MLIDGTSGKIESIYSKQPNKTNHCALILHSHPKHGGNMHDKVVHTTHKAFFENGFNTLRINFNTNNDEDNASLNQQELLDAARAMAWLVNSMPSDSKLWVAGFSFGAWIALQMAIRRLEIARFIAVGLPAGTFDLSFANPCANNGLIIHGKNDGIIDVSLIEKYIKNLKKNNSIVKFEAIDGADHFITEKQPELHKIISQYIKENM